ncbi:MAG TPA: metallophosphoesterase [Candidatus Binatia bacterium]|nr:metallophosphoesterase [Candidatus Binatia bacterium]
MIIIFVSIVQGILFLGHYVVYKTFVRYFNILEPSHLLWTRVVFIVLSISFILVSFLASKYYGPLTKFLYTASAVWLGTLYWLFIASILAAIIFFVVNFFAPGKDIDLIVRGMFVLAIIMSVYGIWNSNQVKVRQATVHLENLPEQWRGRKLVLVADTHLGNVRNVNFAQKISGLIQAQNPDMVLIAGDFYDGTPTEYTKLARVFGDIKSTYGVFFAPGNHEQFGDKSPFLNGLKEGGLKVLDNELVVVDGLQVAGIDYLTGTDSENQRAVLRNMNINPTVASILIKHVPNRIDISEEAGIGLQVSGHTHLGQVYPMSFITKQIFGKFHYGLNKLNKTQIYTTSGAGTWGPPQRVGTNSEIIVITLQ